MSRTYEEVLRAAYSQRSQIKMGLENMRKFTKVFGDPLSGINAIHVAGTNGKGSVCWKMSSALQKAGYKVGLFLSPHISSFRERVRINDELISEKDVKRLITEANDVIKKGGGDAASFFELTTAMAFMYFSEKRPDISIIETGLGGGKDATNIIKPSLSILTSVGLDHIEILGNTIEKIAEEKAEISKPNVPFLAAEHVPHHITRHIAKKNSAPYFCVNDVIKCPEASSELYHCQEKLSDAINTRTAKAGLTLLSKMNCPGNIPAEIIEECSTFRPPCRFEILQCDGVDVVLDVGHNPDAFRALAATLKNQWPEGNRKFRYVLGLSIEKDYTLCLETVLQSVSPDRIHLVQAGSPLSCFSLGLRRALEQAKVSDDIVVVAGSFFIMSEARKELGFKEPRDNVYCR
eukprot:540000_1